MEPADIYMLGHAKIGDAMRRAGLFAAAGKPFMLQNVGGAITRAMVVHMMAAAPTATFSLPQRLRGLAERRGGRAVGPGQRAWCGCGKAGAGADLGPGRIGATESARPAPHKTSGLSNRASKKRHPACTTSPTQPTRFSWCGPNRNRLMPMSYAAPIETEYWDDDGTEESRAMFSRIEREGIVLER